MLAKLLRAEGGGNAMFWNVIDQNRQSVLRRIVSSPPVANCYLAGGTALALLLGHRESIDFDWFTPESFETEQVEAILSGIGNLVVTETKKNTFHGILEGVRVTWLHYPYPLLEESATTEFPGLKLASITDIGTMKLIAASQRGAKKDFVDLYAISQSGVTLDYLIGRLSEKFQSASINYYHIVKSLTYFEDAELEPMPRMFHTVEWADIKQFFYKVQKPMLDSIPK
jgi:hypothetical protein